MLYFVVAFYPLTTLVTLKSLRLELGDWLPLSTELPRASLLLGNSAKLQGLTIEILMHITY